MRPKEKYVICLSCEQLTPKKFCSACGCFIPAKVLIPISECPLGRWGAVEQTGTAVGLKPMEKGGNDETDG